MDKKYPSRSNITGLSYSFKRRFVVAKMKEFEQIDPMLENASNDNMNIEPRMRESRDENEGMGPLTKSEIIIPNIRTENVPHTRFKYTCGYTRKNSSRY